MNPALLNPQTAQALAAALTYRPQLNKENIKQLPPVQMLLGARDFWNAYSNMIDKNLIGFDRYSHAKANAQATKRGKYGELVARAISYVREKTNKNLDPLFKDTTWEEALQDSIEDNKANTFGREQVKKYPNTPIHELLKPYWIEDSSGHVAK